MCEGWGWAGWELWGCRERCWGWEQAGIQWSCRALVGLQALWASPAALLQDSITLSPGKTKPPHHCHQQLCFPVTGRNTAVPLPIINRKRFIKHRDLISLTVKMFLPPTPLAFKFGLWCHAEAIEKPEDIRHRNTLKSPWNKTASDGAAVYQISLLLQQESVQTLLEKSCANSIYP